MTAIESLDSYFQQLHQQVSRNRLRESYQRTAAEGGHNGPYPFQVRFSNLGATHAERCLMCANGVGKTHCAGAEVAIHLTGLYPPWWRGVRYDRPIEVWVGGQDKKQLRESTQKVLIGDLGDELGTGWIPHDCIHPSGPSLQHGSGGVIDQLRVKHTSGRWSTLSVKSYERGYEGWMGAKVDVVWLDEEPKMQIYQEAQMRSFRVDKGRILMTFTPLSGATDVVRRFLDGGPGIALVGATWDDAPHLDPEECKRILATTPAHLIEARSKGVPFMGTGTVFPFDDELIACKPFEIPGYWRRICGIDFGINHPAAAAWLAHDVDADTVYVYDAYRRANEAAAYHVQAINSRGTWIPAAWPHDGLNREKSGGEALIETYRNCGLKQALPYSARYDDDSGGSQPVEPGVNEMYQRMQIGQFKVFEHLSDWFEEKRFYHRDEKARIVAEHNDLMDATRIGMMMLRCGTSYMQANAPRRRVSVDANYNPLSRQQERAVGGRRRR